MGKVYAFKDLMRLGSPTGYLLLFYPCIFGLGLAATSYNDLWYILLFFLGSIVMRSAGCIVNDILDKDFDSMVERTRNRPLVTGAVTIPEAISLLFFLMLIGLMILLFLSKLAITISIIAAIFLAIYPLMKRITFWPQAFLGVTFNIGVLIAYANIAHSLSLSAILAYLGCIFWTLGYDTIYAFMDIEDDVKIGVKSSALFLRNRNYKLWIMCFYVIFTCFMLASTFFSAHNNIIFFAIALITLRIFWWQISTLNIYSRSNCLTRFKSNVYIGLLWGFGITIF